MIYFTKIEPTQHYLYEHPKDVPGDEVVEVILFTKNPRKKDGKFEIETDNYYVLFKIEKNMLYVINAKRK